MYARSLVRGRLNRRRSALLHCSDKRSQRPGNRGFGATVSCAQMNRSELVGLGARRRPGRPAGGWRRVRLRDYRGARRRLPAAPAAALGRIIGDIAFGTACCRGDVDAVGGVPIGGAGRQQQQYAKARRAHSIDPFTIIRTDPTIARRAMFLDVDQVVYKAATIFSLLTKPSCVIPAVPQAAPTKLAERENNGSRGGAEDAEVFRLEVTCRFHDGGQIGSCVAARQMSPDRYTSASSAPRREPFFFDPAVCRQVECNRLPPRVG